jgi:hypothetical protein
MLGDVMHQLQAIAVRQSHVGEAQGVAVAGQQASGFSHVRGAIHAQPHTLQCEDQQFADIRLVIDDEAGR